MERKRKERKTGELKASPKIYYEVIDCYKPWLIYGSEQGKLQKQTKQKLLQGKKGEKPKTESFG